MTTVDPDSLLPAAVERVRQEQTQLRDERDAFRAFRSRVMALSTTAGHTQPSASQHRLHTETHSQLRAVRDAYEATVMAVPHYEQEYNEPYREHLAAEFGTDLAAGLTTGTAFDASLQTAVLAAAKKAARQRDSLLDVLADERAAVTKAQETLLPVAEQLETYAATAFAQVAPTTLDGYLSRLSVLESQCVDVVNHRQEIRKQHRNRLKLPDRLPDFAYLYQDLPVSHPVVAVGSQLVERISRLRTTIHQQLETSPAGVTAGQENRVDQ